MYKRLVTYNFVLFSTLCVFLVCSSKVFCANTPAPKNTAYSVQDIRADIANESITITISGTSTPAYETHEQLDPLRLIMNIAGATLDKKINTEKLIPENQFVKLTVPSAKDPASDVTQFIFQIKEGYQYKVDRDASNLIVRIFPSSASSNAAVPEQTPPAANQQNGVKSPTSGKATTSGEASPAKGASNADATLDELIGSSVAAIEKKQKKANETSQSSDPYANLEDEFAQSGYKKQRISLDFYKIDIHNVFRLFRQVSDVNIVVDEAVKGSITIALNDVPWDFALDIILNLADLKKEERLNTIVIYPKKKEIDWPSKAIDNLAVKADKEVVQQEALIVQQVTSQSKELVEAKDIILKAQAKEKSEDLIEAAALYEKAFALWPSNERLSNKLASLYLVNLHMNAKALFYAQESLKLKPKNDNAALYAAIALANMHRLPEATEYFSQSVSASPPLKEALVSFAAFNENYGHPEAALKLLDKHSAHYGETLDTMLAKARIYDKMGNTTKATEQYRSILSSGFQLRPDLKQYIEGRLPTNTF